jgi:hypothetical protein
MSRKSQISRRGFIRSTTLSAGAVAGLSLAACSKGSSAVQGQEPLFFNLPDKEYDPVTGVAGLLYSQIGYEPGYPVRIVVRLPEKELLNEPAVCRLVATGQEKELETDCVYWGEIWKSHWWVAEFADMKETGEWDVEIWDAGRCVLRDKGLKVVKNLLWDRTLPLASVDMLERRVHFTKVGAGWQDAGTLWVESPAQSAMTIALEELLEKTPGRLDQAMTDRIYKQITVGCNYLVMLREKAEAMGYDRGAMTHDLHGHEKDILPQDAVKAVVALYRASRLLPDTFKKEKNSYRETAGLTFNWLTKTAKPLGDLGLSRFQRGLPEDTVIPDDEWQTRDLVTLCWAALEKWKTEGSEVVKEQCAAFARQILERQITEQQAENGFFGHFLEYPGMKHSEKAWAHGIVNNQFGADIGQIYPNYLMPLIEMVILWPDHPDAEKWKTSLKLFVHGYLIPACRKNPFLIIPLGIFGEEGPVWFCGTFHGTNTIYGYTAALALELAKLLDEPRLRDIAYGNLQWLAGLNGGITRENLKACVIFSTDVPEHVALPASMMCGVGDCWAGTWFATRGVICNGFSTGKQFVYDVEPKKANDGPFSLTDEDWIPHSAGWLTALVRM